MAPLLLVGHKYDSDLSHAVGACMSVVAIPRVSPLNGKSGQISGTSGACSLMEAVNLAASTGPPTAATSKSCISWLSGMSCGPNISSSGIRDLPQAVCQCEARGGKQTCRCASAHPRPHLFLPVAAWYVLH